MKKELTVNDFKMTRKTADRIIVEMSVAQREVMVWRKANVKFKSSTRERFCLLLDGVKIRNSSEWEAYKTPQGFTRALLSKLDELCGVQS